MHLADVRLGLPILRLQVRIHHSTPRRPTAFERVLLKLCDRLGSNVAYNNIALDRLFSDFLGVTDPIPLVEPILHELVRISVLRSSATELLVDRLSLRDIEVTERGRQLLADDQLPSHPQSNDEVYYYDPIGNRLLSPLEATLAREEPPQAPLDAEAFRDLLPEELIRAHVARGGSPWWSSSSRIDRIERASATSVLWREATAGIQCSDGEIQIQTKDPAQAEYIRGLPSAEIYKRVLATSILQSGTEADEWRSLPAVDLATVPTDQTGWLPIQQALESVPAGAAVCILNQSAPFITMPDHVAPRQVIIGFDATAAHREPELTWNDTGDGCLVRFGAPFPLPAVALASTSQIVSLFRASVMVGRDPYDLPLARIDTGDQPNSNVLSVLNAVATTLRRANEDDGVALASLWMPAAEYWSVYVKGSLASSGDLGPVLDHMRHMRQRVASLTGKDVDEEWEAAAARIIGDDLSKRGRLDLDQLSTLMKAIEDCTITAPAVVANLIEDVVACSPIPKDLKEYAETASAVHRGGPAWRIPFPSPLHSPQLVRDAIDAFGNDELLRTLGNDNRFDDVLQQLHTAYKGLSDAFGGTGLKGLGSEDDYLAAIKSKDAGAIDELAVKCGDRYRDLCLLLQDFETDVKNSALGKAMAQVESLNAVLRKLVGALNKRFRAVYVVDTSALVEEPELLRKFGDDELVVVSKRVIEELDDKKRDESLRPAVAHATRLLREIPTVRIEFCEGDLSLLSPDYRNKGDNLILSVAVKFKKHRPILLTNDNLLALKAKAEGISTMDSKGFSQRVRPRDSTPSATRPPQHPRGRGAGGDRSKPSRRQ